MLVQRVVLPDSGRESWTVLGDDDAPVAPIERYLAFLSDIKKPPNTVKAYAHDLKDWFSFLTTRGLDWREVRLEDVGEFIAWLRLPPASRSGQVAVLPSVIAHCSEATVNRKLCVVGVLSARRAARGRSGRVAHRVAAGAGTRGVVEAVLASHQQVQPVAGPCGLFEGCAQASAGADRPRGPDDLNACGRLRDRLLFALLYDSGIEIGEALGLRHEDIASAEREITIRARVNDNGARTKSGMTRTIPVSAELVRLFADYLHEEYGDLDSDYVFVNLWGGPHGHPLTYPAVYDLVRRLRRATGIDFDPHWWHHTYTTRLLRDGTPVEVVSRLLGHASITTTLSCYGHLGVEDARTILDKAGCFDHKPVSW